MKRKSLLLVTFLLMLYIGPMVFAPTYMRPPIVQQPFETKDFITSSGENWLNGWSYRKNATIDGTTDAGTNYQVRLNVHYDTQYSFTFQDAWADSAHQGVATDGTYVYTSNSSALVKYFQNGDWVNSHDTTLDGTHGDYIGDMVYVSGYLYVASHDSGFTDHMIMKYDATDLSYVTEYDVNEPDVADWNGGLSITYSDNSFWLLSDSDVTNAEPQIQKYSSSFVYQDKWTFDGYDISGSWHYQGFDWLDDEYIFCTIHEGSNNNLDIYRWTGTTFVQYQRVPQVEWTDGSTYEGSQGIDIEEGSPNYVWFASRGGAGAAQQVGKYLLNELMEDSGQDVYLNQKCQSDYDDIRFVDDDGETVLDYWREDAVNDSEAVFWIEIADDLGSEQLIYLYYGNDEASSLSNGPNTFPFYEDWTSESIRPSLWDIKASDGSVSWSVTDANHAYVIKIEGASDTERYYFISDDTFNSSYALRARGKLESTVASGQITQMGFEAWSVDGKQQLKSYQGSHEFQCVDSDGNVDDNPISIDYFDSFQVYDILLENTYSKLYSDDVLVHGTGDNSPHANDYNLILYCRDTEYDLYNDWIFVRKYIPDEPAFSSFGTEESDPHYWHTINTVELIFVIKFDEWALDMFLIFFGLILIPTSTIYLVYGGRNAMSKDKLFYGLIAFIFGWALFLGGIM